VPVFELNRLRVEINRTRWCWSRWRKLTVTPVV